jgi:hypothetical protein
VYTYRAVRDVDEGFIGFGAFILPLPFPPRFSFAAAKALAVGSIIGTGFSGLGMLMSLLKTMVSVIYQFYKKKLQWIHGA